MSYFKQLPEQQRNFLESYFKNESLMDEFFEYFETIFIEGLKNRVEDTIAVAEDKIHQDFWRDLIEYKEQLLKSIDKKLIESMTAKILEDKIKLLETKKDQKPAIKSFADIYQDNI